MAKASKPNTIYSFTVPHRFHNNVFWIFMRTKIISRKHKTYNNIMEQKSGHGHSVFSSSRSEICPLLYCQFRTKPKSTYTHADTERNSTKKPKSTLFMRQKKSASKTTTT